MSAQERRQIAVIGLGANVGEPRAQLEAAFAALAQLPGTRLLRRSSLYRTAPMGRADQSDFINAAVMITTSLPAPVLLAHLLEIEHKQGRRRAEKNGPRTLHEVRKACAWYARGLYGCNALRLRVWEAPDLATARTLVEDYFAQLIERQSRLGLSPEMAPGRDEIDAGFEAGAA